MERFLNDIKLECKYLLESRGQSSLFLNNWLLESHGIPDQIDEMLEAILTSPFLERSYKAFVEEPNTGLPFTCKFDMYSRVKAIYRNFLGPKSFLILTFQNGGNISVGGAYAGTETGEWNKEENYLEGASIEMTCRVPKKVTSFKIVQQHMRGALAHELTHAFEDYNRRCLGGRDLGTVLADRDYPSVEDEDSMLEWFTYILDPTEQHAFISMACQQTRDNVKTLIRMGKIDKFENIRNIDTLLKYTEFWGPYVNVRDWVENSQWDRYPDYLKKDIIDKYNSLVKPDASSPYKDRNVPTTYNQVVKKIKHRWHQFDQKLRVHVSQALADALYKKSPKDPDLSGKKLSESFIYQVF